MMQILLAPLDQLLSVFINETFKTSASTSSEMCVSLIQFIPWQLDQKLNKSLHFHRTRIRQFQLERTTLVKVLAPGMILKTLVALIRSPTWS